MEFFENILLQNFRICSIRIRNYAIFLGYKFEITLLKFILQKFGQYTPKYGFG